MLWVQPRPPARAVILAGYRALEDTVASLDDLFEAGILPSTAELLDKSAVDALQLWRPELELPAGEAVLFIEVEGTPEQVAANVRYTDGIVRKRATVTRFAEDEKEITSLWAARSGLAAAMTGRPRASNCAVEAIPDERVGDGIRKPTRCLVSG